MPRHRRDADRTQEIDPPLRTSARALRRRVDDLVDEPRVRTTLNWVSAGLVLYLFVQLFWPSPLGVLVQGVVIGGLTALISFGIALVYRANRIVNFAQGELGAIPASLAVLLIVGPGLPYFVALPIGIGSAVVLGILVEFLLIRRFFKAPRLILTVVTIPVGLFLAAIGTILPRAFDIDTPPQSFPSPFEFSFSIGRTVFHGNEVIAMLAVPGCIALLAGFLRYTNLGIAVRATAESADRASLLGIPVKRVETIVWVIASVLGFVAVFLRAGIVGLPFGQLLGPSILIRALAAAVVGRMERLPTILGAAVGLGVLESAILFETGRAVLVDPILFGLIIVALLFQRRTRAARGDETTSTWQAARDVRPIPRELVHLPEVRWGRRGVLAVLAVVAVVAPLPMSGSQASLASVIVILSIVAVSLVVLTGWAGQISLGQIAFLGIGAAVCGYLVSDRGWDPVLAIVCGGGAGAVAAMVIGLPALRIRGLFLAVTTLSFALATSSYFLKDEFFGWLPTSRFDRPPLLGRIWVVDETRFYYFALSALVFAIVAARGIRQSRAGRALIAVRENERGAQAYGVGTVGAKLSAFAISGFLAAMAGGIFVLHQQVLGINPYGVERSFTIFIMTVAGGLGSITGGVLGVVFFQGLTYFQNVFPEAIRGVITLIASSLGAVVILLMLPNGLAQVVFDVRDRALRMVAERRGILVPSLVADAREGSERAGRGQPEFDLGLTLPGEVAIATAADGVVVEPRQPDLSRVARRRR